VERLVELAAVVDLAASTLTAEQARLWARTPNAALHWRKPLDAVGDGHYLQAIGALQALAA
jgi:hypothetical protein